jgi:streptogramin lyase
MRCRSPFNALLVTLAAAAPLHAAKIVEFTIPTAGSQPYTIVAGPDGRLFFTEIAGNKIGAMTTGGSFQEYPIPTPNASPFGIMKGRFGDLYFAKLGPGIIGSMTDYGFHYLDPAETFVDPHQLVWGPDHRVWFTDSGSSKVHAYKYVATGTFVQASAEMTGLTPGGAPYGLTSYQDTYVAVVEGTANKIAICSPSSNSCDEYAIPTPSSEPRRIVEGFSKDLWFTEASGNKIGRMYHSFTSFDEYPIPTAASSPLGITRGPDGNIWFTEAVGNKIGRITPSGVITEYPIPTANSFPTSICVGPDGNIYFTEFNANKIGKLDVFISGDVNDDGNANVTDVFYLISFLFAGGPAPK